jgi:hypothetical protein
MLCGACVRESERVNQGEGREENATREMNSNAKLLAFFSFFVFVRVLKNSTSTFFRPRPFFDLDLLLDPVFLRSKRCFVFVLFKKGGKQRQVHQQSGARALKRRLFLFCQRG